MDAYIKEVLACVCSASCETDFVLDTINQLIELHGSELKTDTYSDQGCQYTSSRFVSLIQDYGLRQSMSRRGNCWDNAQQESLFGRMKDEIHIIARDGHTIVTQKVLGWIDYYNNERYQWSLAKLSPTEYYRYVTTGEYPITSSNIEPKINFKHNSHINLQVNTSIPCCNTVKDYSILSTSPPK